MIKMKKKLTKFVKRLKLMFYRCINTLRLHIFAGDRNICFSKFINYVSSRFFFYIFYSNTFILNWFSKLKNSFRFTNRLNLIITFFFSFSIVVLIKKLIFYNNNFEENENNINEKDPDQLVNEFVRDMINPEYYVNEDLFTSTDDLLAFITYEYLITETADFPLDKYIVTSGFYSYFFDSLSRIPYPDLFFAKYHKEYVPTQLTSVDFKVISLEIFFFILIIGLFIYATILVKNNKEQLEKAILTHDIVYLAGILLFVVFSFSIFSATMGGFPGLDLIKLPEFSFNLNGFTHFVGTIINDRYSWFSKNILTCYTAAIIFCSLNYIKFEKIEEWEFVLFILFSLFISYFLLSSFNFLLFFICIEIISIASYYLACIRRLNPLTAEAAVKYFLLGAMASIFLLIGLAFIYGFFGTLYFSKIKLEIFDMNYNFFTTNKLNILLIIGLISLSVNFLFKISAAPFHFWTVDVYEGVSLIVTSYFAIIVKLVIFFTYLRIFMYLFDNFSYIFQPIFLISSILSMIVGSIGGLYQTSIKRLFAYSTINHMGYILGGVATFTFLGIKSSIMYILLYNIMLIGLFGCLFIFRINKNMKKINYINQLTILRDNMNNGLSIELIAFVIILFSFAGIPPLMGFYSKWFLFESIMASDIWFLVFFAIIASLISCFYYLRLIKILLFDEEGKFAFSHLNIDVFGFKYKYFFDNSYDPYEEDDLKYYFEPTSSFLIAISVFIIFFFVFASDFAYFCEEITGSLLNPLGINSKFDPDVTKYREFVIQLAKEANKELNSRGNVDAEIVETITKYNQIVDINIELEKIIKQCEFSLQFLKELQELLYANEKLSETEEGFVRNDIEKMIQSYSKILKEAKLIKKTCADFDKLDDDSKEDLYNKVDKLKQDLNDTKDIVKKGGNEKYWNFIYLLLIVAVIFTIYNIHGTYVDFGTVGYYIQNTINGLIDFYKYVDSQEFVDDLAYLNYYVTKKFNIIYRDVYKFIKKICYWLWSFWSGGKS